MAEARGVIMYAAQKCGAEIVEFTPLQIKSAVAGNGRADKRAVISMTCKLIDVPEVENDPTTPKATKGRLDDEYDAIACGLNVFFAHFRPQKQKKHTLTEWKGILYNLHIH